MKDKTLINRREILKSAGMATAAVVAAPMINRGRFRLFAGSAIEYSRQAIDLIGRATVIDMLSVLTLDFNKQAKWFKDPETFTAADLQPFLDSGINIFHPAIGQGGPNAYDSALQFFASWNGFIANDGDHFMRVDSPADLKRIKKSGKMGIILGLQNSEHFRRPETHVRSDGRIDSTQVQRRGYRGNSGRKF